MFEEQVKKTSLLKTSLRNMEVQMGQLAQELHRRPQGGLPSDTVPNPKGKEQCHAVTLRSGKKLEKPIMGEAESNLAKEKQPRHYQPEVNEQLQQENEETQEIPEAWYKEYDKEQEAGGRTQQEKVTQESPELQTDPEKEKSV